MTSLFLVLKKNILPGISVAVLSFPLVISLAVAMGAPPLMGVLAAIWAGGIAALLGGSHYNVTGPAGALTGVLTAYTLSHGASVLPFISIASGLILLLAYLIRLSRTLIYVPNSVMHGFNLGVACILITTAVKEVDTHTWPLFLGGLALLFALRTWTPRLPASLVVAALGISLGYAESNGFLSLSWETLGDRFQNLQGSLIQMPNWSQWHWDGEFFKISLTVAAVALIQTLLSGKSADRMTHSKFHPQREILGLALANIVGGVFGACPSTASISRTALNVKQEATHKSAAVFAAIFTGVIALLFMKAFAYLPIALVSSALAYTSLRMVQHEDFLQLYKHNRGDLFLAIVVAAIAVGWDPLFAILTGSTWALLTFLRHMSKGEAEITANSKPNEFKRVSQEELAHQGNCEVLVYRFYGILTYINIQPHIEILGELKDVKTVILGFRNVFYIDYDGIEGLNEIVERLEAKNIKVVLSGISKKLEPHILHTTFYQSKKEANGCFTHNTEAIEAFL